MKSRNRPLKIYLDIAMTGAMIGAMAMVLSISSLSIAQAAEPNSAANSKMRVWLSKGAEGLAFYKSRLIRRYHLMSGKALPGTPDLKKRQKRLAETGLKMGAPIFLRLFKREAKLELWIYKHGKFHLFTTYPVCRFSGTLGPKQKTGDKQSPEGFYTVSKGQLNPASRWLRSFNLGYPNLYDRSHGRTGSFLMVHGGCASIGCYAMTNDVIREVWAFVTAALKAGQARIHVHAYPFRPTTTNMYIHAANKWAPFWAELKTGYDLFEKTHLPPMVGVCKGHYTLKSASASSKGAHRLTRACYGTPSTGS